MMRERSTWALNLGSMVVALAAIGLRLRASKKEHMRILVRMMLKAYAYGSQTLWAKTLDLAGAHYIDY